MLRTHNLSLTVLCGALAAQTPLVDVTPFPLAGTAVHDPLRGSTLVFGGSPNRLWEWDGATFRQRLGTAHSPVAGTWDPSRHRFFGIDGTTWDGANWNSAPMPAGVTTFDAIAFDEGRQRLVGVSTGAVAEWDGTQWISIAPPASPTAVRSLVYDQTRGRCVLAAGTSPVLFDWDGAQWSVLDASLPSQGASFTYSMTYDPQHGRLVVLGDTTFGAVAPRTWSFANGVWQAIPTPGTFSARTSRLVHDGLGLLRVDTVGFPAEGLWRLEGNVWRRLMFEHPVRRSEATLASSPSLAGTFVFGGRDTGNTMLGDTWNFDGGWKHVTGAISPPPRRGASMAWSPVDQAFVLFGGQDGNTRLDDTWRFDGVSWQQVLPNTVPFETLRLATDPAGGVLGVSATGPRYWQWNGADWVNNPLPTTISPGFSSICHDPVRNVAVAASYYGIAEWDGVNWTQHSSPIAVNAQLSFRPDTQRVLATSAASTALEWNGVAWTPAQGLGTLSIEASAPDFSRGQLWTFGNTTASPTGGNRAAMYVTTTPAAATRVAYGCSLGHTPGMLTDGVPTPGNSSFGVIAETFVGHAPTAIPFGFQLQGTHLGGGCVSWLQTPPALHFLVSDGTGRARLHLPIPNSTGLLGVAILAQTGAMDPAHSPIGSFVVSDVLRFVVGD